MINEAISKLVTYALRTGLISQYDTTWAVNAILEVLKLDSYADPGVEWSDIDLAAVLDELTDDAYARGVLAENSIVYRDLFDTALMGRLTPRPAQVIEKFQTLCWEDPKKGIDWYYKNLYSQPKMPNGREFFSPGEANFRRHTLCMARKFNDVWREKIRPDGILSVVNTGS